MKLKRRSEKAQTPTDRNDVQVLEGASLAKHNARQPRRMSSNISGCDSSDSALPVLREETQQEIEAEEATSNPSTSVPDSLQKRSDAGEEARILVDRVLREATMLPDFAWRRVMRFG